MDARGALPSPSKASPKALQRLFAAYPYPVVRCLWDRKIMLKYEPPQRLFEASPTPKPAKKRAEWSEKILFSSDCFCGGKFGRGTKFNSCSSECSARIFKFGASQVKKKLRAKNEALPNLAGRIRKPDNFFRAPIKRHKNKLGKARKVSACRSVLST